MNKSSTIINYLGLVLLMVLTVLTVLIMSNEEYISLSQIAKDIESEQIEALSCNDFIIAIENVNYNEQACENWLAAFEHCGCKIFPNLEDEINFIVKKMRKATNSYIKEKPIENENIIEGYNGNLDF